MRLSPAIPVLRVLSVEKAKAFYLDYLGFTLEFEHRFDEGFPLYAEIYRSDLVLHLSEQQDDTLPGAMVFVGVEDIDTLHRELVARQHASGHCGTTPGIEAVEWGWQFKVKDPFGNRLWFCERMYNEP